MAYSKLDRTRLVKPAFRSDVRTTGEFWSVEHTKVNRLTMEVNRSTPFAALLTDAKKFNLRIRMAMAHVLTVSGNGYIAKILYSVIARIPIYVVYNAFGPNASCVEPCKAVGEIPSPVNANVNVSARVYRASRSTSGGVRTGANPTRERTSIWAIGKKFAQALCGKIDLSHAVSPVKKWFGQKPARVISTGGLRYFITRAFSGATGSPQCLHESAQHAADVRIPANHRRIFNPLGALTPFNSL